MDSEVLYVNNFFQYINNFIANIRPDDPLPVRAPSYKVTETEIDGQIIDIVYHYLNHRECPPYIRSLVAHRVWTAIRNPEANGLGEDDDAMDMVDHGNQIFEPVKLIHDVTSRANDVMKELQATLSQSQVEALPRFLPVSQYAIKNTRRKMEDRHVIIQDLDTLYNLNFGQPHSYYGVFDGHAGSDAAVYSAAHLHQYLIQNPLYEIDPVAALKHAFYFTDTNFCKKYRKERLKGGTTAVVALIREKRLVVAWLGDSQALLVRKRNPVQIVQPHTPEIPTERKRIEELDGCVVNIQGTWRVLGQLAVSRAIGDVDYKPYVSSECDIKSLEINGDEDFLILACDGLWDTVLPETAVNIVYSYLIKNDGDTDGVGRCLVEAARSAGSEDNITAVVVFLRPVNILMEEEADRKAQGQVPEVEPFVTTEKDALPASINAIFTPPPSFDIADSIPTEQEFAINIKNGELGLDLDTQFSETHPANDISPGGNIPGEVVIHDSDSDEGVGPDFGGPENNEQPSSARGAAAPTEEEVDAVLAELDSIPDGVCETGDIEEEDEDEEWAYYKMEPQSDVQNEDVIVTTSSTAPEVPQDVLHGVDELPPLVQPVHVHSSDMSEANTGSPSASPPAPSSPRTVEGFITSVELNTPEESFNTSLAINQSTEYFNGGQIEQNSGPFSVYVSSSPEPAAVETPPIQVQSSMQDDFRQENALFMEDIGLPQSPVEIVHAQSTVEVVSSPSLVDVPIPDIMTQSVTGDLPAEPFILSPDVILPPPEDTRMDVDNVEEARYYFDNFCQAEKQEILVEHLEENSDVFDQTVMSEMVPHHEVGDEKVLLTDEAHHVISEESSNLIEQLNSSVKEVSNVVEEINATNVEGNFAVSVEDTYINADLRQEVETCIDDVIEEKENFINFADSDLTQEHFDVRDRFADKISKAFEEPLDEMIMSYHEDQNPLMEPCLLPTEPELVEPEVSSVPESGIPDKELAQVVEALTEDLSKIDIKDETTVESVMTPTVPVAELQSAVEKPVTAPRTKPKTSPPKPSPRSIKATTPAGSASATRTTLKTNTAPLSQKSKTTTSKPASVSAPKSRLSSTFKATTVSASKTSTTTSKPTAPTAAAMRSKLSSSTRTTTTTTTTSSAVRSKLTHTSAPTVRMSTSSSTAMKKEPATLKPATATRIGIAKGSTSRMTNGVATTTMSATTATSRTAAHRTPADGTSKTNSLTKKPASSTASAAAGTTRRPLMTSRITSTTTGSSATSTLKQRESDKDSKNTTNRLLSSTTTKSGTSTKTALTKTSQALPKTRTVPPKTTKSPGLKAKSEAAKATAKSPKKGTPKSELSNGENKIVHEETAIEVKEKMISEEMKTVPDSAAEVVQDVLVNGDH